MKRSITSIVIFLAFWSCSEKNGITSPISAGDMTGILFFSSFESDNSPTTTGWQVWPSAPSSLVSFSRDVPSGGGYWSLNLQCKGNRDSVGGIVFRTSVSMSDTIENYIVSFWAKGKGSANLTVTDTSGGWLNGNSINVSSWTFFADTLNRYQSRYNTLEVFFGAWSKDSVASLYLDNVKIFKRKPDSLVLANQSLKPRNWLSARLPHAKTFSR